MAVVQQREERILNIGLQYAGLILEKWGEIISLREEFRQNVLEGRIDRQLMNLYITKLSSVYIEIYPKIVERDDFNNHNTNKELFTERFEGFIDFYRNPTMFYGAGNGQKIFEFEEVIRIALEKLKLLDFEE
jgi:hypothetical protein